MQWFQMASGLVAAVLAVANAVCVQAGHPDPIAVKQVKTEKTATFEGRWIVVSGRVNGDEQDMKGDKVFLAKGKFTLEGKTAKSRKPHTRQIRAKTEPHRCHAQARSRSGQAAQGNSHTQGKPAQDLPGPSGRCPAYRGVGEGRFGPHTARPQPAESKR